MREASVASTLSSGGRRRRAAVALSLGVIAAAACSAGPPETVSNTDTALVKGIAPSPLYSSSMWVDGNVQSFKLPEYTTPGLPLVYVLGTNGNLWREQNTMATRTEVDSNVLDYKPIDGNIVWVLETNHVLYKETYSPASKVAVVSGVYSFDIESDFAEAVYYTNSSGQLFSQYSGTNANPTPPPPTMLATSVKALQWAANKNLDLCVNGGLYVLGGDNWLFWCSHPGYDACTLLDTNIASFHALNDGTVMVETTASPTAPVYLEYSSTTRRLVDTNARSFWPMDPQYSFVVDESLNLWRDNWSARNRTPVDSNVSAFAPAGTDSVYVLHTDQNLYLESIIAPLCPYSFPAITCNGYTSLPEYNLISAWGVENTTGTCPTIPAVTGSWAATAPGTDPNDGVTTPMSCSSLGLPSNCCLYVWQPNGGFNQASPPEADPAFLCSSTSKAIVAYQQCAPLPKCPVYHPGHPSCPTCAW